MKYLSGLFLLFIFFSCTNSDKVPPNVLEREPMYKLIWDLARVDEYVSSFIAKDSAVDQRMERIRLYEQVFSVHGTSQEEFRRSMDFYQGRPDQLKLMMDSLRAYERKMLEDPYASKPFVIDSVRRKPGVIDSVEIRRSTGENKSP